MRWVAWMSMCPHEMHYHDKWGHLSIDLLPGPQHLSGDAAVGFARYRHPDAGKKANCRRRRRSAVRNVSISCSAR